MAKHRMPENITEMLRLCRFFDPKRGIESILDHIDWTATRPAQVYSAVLNRLPESKELAVPSADYSPRDHFEDALGSREFQENLIALVAAAFPEKRRLVFVHIPRTAGTDLEWNLEKRYPHIHHKITVPEDVTKANLFTKLKDFSENVDLANEIFFSGHIELRWYCDQGMCRFGDHLFTIVRDPIDALMSWINYVATVVSDPENDGRPDRRKWLSSLGMESVPEFIDDAYRMSLATKALRTESIVGQNIMCRYLGSGTAQSALEKLAICGVEITCTNQYPKWLHRNWNINTTTQQMRSLPVLSKQSLSREDYDYLYERTKEDQILYKRISDSMSTSGELSVNGLDLVS